MSYHEEDGSEDPEVGEERWGQDDLHRPALQGGKVEEGLAGDVVNHLILLLVFVFDLPLLGFKVQDGSPLQKKTNNI